MFFVSNKAYFIVFFFAIPADAAIESFVVSVDVVVLVFYISLLSRRQPTTHVGFKIEI